MGQMHKSGFWLILVKVGVKLTPENFFIVRLVIYLHRRQRKSVEIFISNVLLIN